MKARSMLAGALGLLTALSAVGAHAVFDAKIYPGSMCKPGTSAISYTLTGSSNLSSYKNNHGAQVGVACPIVREYWEGTGPAVAYVGVHVPSTTSRVWCAIFQANSSANTVSYGSDITPAGVTGRHEIVVSTPMTPGYFDALVLKCDVDPNGKIYSYNVDESTATD